MTGSLDLLADLRSRYGGREFSAHELRSPSSYGASRLDTLLGNGHVIRRRLSAEERDGTSAMYAYWVAEPKHAPECWFDVETGWHCVPACPVQPTLPLG